MKYIKNGVETEQRGIVDYIVPVMAGDYIEIDGYPIAITVDGFFNLKTQSLHTDITKIIQSKIFKNGEQ